jgi:hypothetical protein
MRILLTFTLLLLLQACRHPLAIEGEGDIIERLIGHRGCMLEEFQAGSPRCAENDAIDEDYIVSYRADPRPGWEFVGWEGTACIEETPEGFCEFDVSEPWVDFINLKSPDKEFPATVAVFRQLKLLASGDCGSQLWSGTVLDIVPDAPAACREWFVQEDTGYAVVRVEIVSVITSLEKEVRLILPNGSYGSSFIIRFPESFAVNTNAHMRFQDKLGIGVIFELYLSAESRHLAAKDVQLWWEIPY